MDNSTFIPTRAKQAQDLRDNPVTDLGQLEEALALAEKRERINIARNLEEYIHQRGDKMVNAEELITNLLANHERT